MHVVGEEVIDVLRRVSETEESYFGLDLYLRDLEVTHRRT